MATIPRLSKEATRAPYAKARIGPKTAQTSAGRVHKTHNRAQSTHSRSRWTGWPMWLVTEAPTSAKGWGAFHIGVAAGL